MSRTFSEVQINKTEKSLKQFSEFAGIKNNMLSEYIQLLKSGLEENSEETKSFFESCDNINSSFQRLLDKEELTFDEKCHIIDKMTDVGKMISDKDTENKQFIAFMCCLGAAVLVVAVKTLTTALGGNIKIDTNILENGK